MFDSDLDRQGNTGRRIFLAGITAGVAGLLLRLWSKPRLLRVAASVQDGPSEVTIVQFADSGQPLEKFESPEL